MGCVCLFCCFRTCSPDIIAVVGLVSNFISFAFLIWAIADLSWKRDGAKSLYIISLILMSVSFILFLLVFIFQRLRKGPNQLTYNKLAKYFCLLIILLCILTFIFIIIGGIMEICHLKDLKNVPDHDWAALFVPSILTLISCIMVILCANILYKIFNENILTSVADQQFGIRNAVNQNSITYVPNMAQDNVVITGNNVGAIPPKMENNQPYPVNIQPNVQV